jgi:tetratricopeptide (TPR) repeat protein
VNAALAAKVEQARREIAQGQAETARDTLQRALRQHPGDPDVPLALSIVLLRLGQRDQAEYWAERGAQLGRTNPGSQIEAGNVLLLLGRHQKAIEAFARAAQLGAAAEGEHGVANVLLEQERFAEALEHSSRAWALRPMDAPVVLVYASLLNTHGRAAEAADAVRRALAAGSNPDLAALLAFIMNYVPGAGREDIFRAHAAYGAAMERGMPRAAPTFPNSRDPQRRLRVGLISHELRRHPVAIFLRPFLEHHDRAETEVVLYATSPKRDEVTEQLRALAAGWCDLAALADEAAAARIRDDAIDILIDTSGITTGQRHELLLHRPAPVQAMYLGYPGTTGLPVVDYRIVDGGTEPQGAEAFSSERLVRLEPSFLCFGADPEAGNHSTPPSATRGHVTFGSFNSTQKINAGVIDAWCRILHDQQASRLVLKTVNLADEGLRAVFAREFERRGIARERVEVRAPIRGYGRHMAQYHDIDVALDTFPYNGTTTTFEALWMGVPVVGIRGESHAARVGQTILGSLGLAEWVGESVDGYVALANRLAGDVQGRARLRSPDPGGLRATLAASRLMDGRWHASQMQAALRRMWRGWCSEPR